MATFDSGGTTTTPDPDYDPTQDPLSPFYNPTGSAFDPGFISPPPPPTFIGGGKTPGGGLAYPVFTDPTTSEYVDPLTGTGTGFTTGGTPTTTDTGGAYVPPPPYYGPQPPIGPTDATPPPPPEDPFAPPLPPSPPTTPPVNPPVAPPVAPPPTPMPPAPFMPEGGIPTAPSFTSRAMRPNAPAMSGGPVGPRAPQSTNFRPSAPMWARGLQRSPFQQFIQRNAQSNLFGGFQPEQTALTEEELRRRQQMAQLPSWALPG